MFRINDIHKPESLDKALQIIGETPELRPIAGGTDLVIQLSESLKPTSLLDISQIPKLREIGLAGDSLFIGASATHSEIASSDLVRSNAPLIASSSAIMGGPAIRNRATIGGNVANASPVAESLPTLIAHAAEIVLRSANGSRKMAVEDFHLGPGKNTLEENELILGFEIPICGADFFGFYERLGSRAAVTITKVGIALTAIHSGSVLRDVRIALSAVAPRVIRAHQSEAMLEGAEITSELIGRAAQMLITECTPISDFRSTCEYRSDMVGQLFRIGFAEFLET